MNIRHTSRIARIYVIYVWRLHEWDHLVNYTRLCRCVLCVFVCVRLCVFVRMCVFPFLSPFFSLSFLSFFQNKVTCALTTQRILSVFAPNPCVTKFEPMRETLQKRFSCVTRPPNRLQKNAHMFGEVRHVREPAELWRNSANFGTLFGEPPFLAIGPSGCYSVVGWWGPPLGRGSFLSRFSSIMGKETLLLQKRLP